LKRSTQLIGDGKPQMLTSDDFWELSQEKAKEQQQQEQQKKDQQDAQKLFHEAVAQWEVDDTQRKVDAAAICEKNKKAKADFDTRRAAALKKGIKIKASDNPAPLPVPKAIEKPKLMDFLAGGGKRDAGDTRKNNGSESGEEFEAVESSGSCLSDSESDR